MPLRAACKGCSKVGSFVNPPHDKGALSFSASSDTSSTHVSRNSCPRSQAGYRTAAVRILRRSAGRFPNADTRISCGSRGAHTPCRLKLEASCHSALGTKHRVKGGLWSAETSAHADGTASPALIPPGPGWPISKSRPLCSRLVLCHSAHLPNHLWDRVRRSFVNLGCRFYLRN